jgi:hypothetical protein
MSPESLILMLAAAIQAFKGLSKLKCQTYGIDFSDEGWKDQSAHFKGLDLQVAEIKDLKAVYSLM